MYVLYFKLTKSLSLCLLLRRLLLFESENIFLYKKIENSLLSIINLVYFFRAKKIHLKKYVIQKSCFFFVTFLVVFTKVSCTFFKPYIT